jgi:integrase
VKRFGRIGVGSAITNRSLAALRRMLNLARQEGKISSVPWIPMLKEPPARKGFVSWEQFDTIVAALPDELKPLITFLGFCGCRLGEAKQIRWEQVDLTAALIHLEGEQTKSGDARDIPLPDVLVKMLESLPREGTVFCATNLRKAWIKACVKTGFGKQDDEGHYSGLIIHDLRRSAINFLMKSGATESEAMKISGHKTNAVFKRYNIVSTKDVSNVMRRVEASKTENGQNMVKIAPQEGQQKQLNP